MLFNSYFFIFLFLPITLFGFFKISGSGQTRAGFAWLIFASLFFYGWWNPVYLILIIGSVIFNYRMGFLLTHPVGPVKQKWLLALGVMANLGLLGFFKYANFFVDSANTLLNSEVQLAPIILPLAISFFTFQQISYLCDVGSERIPKHDFVHYCLYVTFFPQLIAGPIVRASEILPQYTEEKSRGFNHEDFAIGLTIFIIGLFKKVVIADGIALSATPVFQAAQDGTLISFFDAWVAAFAYTFQLYFDFSGYSDMAIGLGRMLGFRLPINFNSPYKANNIVDFWRRWHMTLSRFMMDYLYIPLGGNRKGPVRQYSNLFFTMLLGGLWHGASWTFVVWGAMHGIYLGINHAWQNVRQKWGIQNDSVVYRCAARLLTLFAVVLAWVLFRAGSFRVAMAMYRGMAGLNGVVVGGSLLKYLGPFKNLVNVFGWTVGREIVKQGRGLLRIIGLLAAVWILPNSMQWTRRYQPALTPPPEWQGPQLLGWRPHKAWAVIVLTAALISIFKMTSVSEFLYFQF